MTTENIIRKVTSRKFWLCTAAFLGSVATSVAGIATDNQTVAAIGTVCGSRERGHLRCGRAGRGRRATQGGRRA